MKRNRAKTGQGTAAVVLILIVLVIGAYFFIPNFKTWVDNLLNQATGGDWGGFGLTIYYEDGTSETFGPSATTIIEMSVQYGSKSISKIVWELWLKVSYTGEVQSNTVLGTITLQEVAGTPVFKTGPVSYTTPLLNSVSTKIATLELTATEIESKFPVGMCVINADAPIAINMNFTDGTSDSADATAQGGIAVFVQPDGSITGVTVSLNPTVIYT